MTHSFSVLVVLFALFPSTTLAQDTMVPHQRKSFHLFLLVGQSNMAGRGSVEDQDVETHDRVLMLNRQNEWVAAKAPLHFDKPTIVGVGLGRTFALDYIQKYPGVTVGLIPCAVGGSPIAAWEPGGFHVSTKTHPYDDAMPRAMLALKSGTLKGILWHQGESDSNAELAPVYREKLHALIARLRTNLQAAAVPFVAGQMGQFAERPWSDAKKSVDRVHRTLPEEIENTAFANSDKLSHRGDKVHFDSRSYRELGHRYFAAYQTLTTKSAAPETRQ